MQLHIYLSLPYISSLVDVFNIQLVMINRPFVLVAGQYSTACTFVITGSVISNLRLSEQNRQQVFKDVEVHINGFRSVDLARVPGWSRDCWRFIIAFL